MSLTSLVSNGPLLVAAPVAAAAGALSFLSPCVLPLVPGYLSYVTGMSGAELAARRGADPATPDPATPDPATPDLIPGTGAGGAGRPAGTVALAGRVTLRRGRVLAGAALFVAGFSFVFVAEGALFGSLGSALRTHERGLEEIFGALTVLFGLVFAGALTALPLTRREFRLHASPGVGLAAAPVLGVLFGLGWTPCIGPTLGAVLGLSAQDSTAGRGALLTLVYCLGLGIPFLLVAVAFRRALGAFAVIKQHYAAVTLVGGLLLVAVGVAELTGAWSGLIRQLQDAVGGGTGSAL